MPDTSNKSFALNLKAMRWFALYPPETYQMPVPILQCVYLCLKEDVTFGEIVKNTFLIAALACFIPKFWPFINHGLRIKKNIHYFDDPRFEVENPEQEKIISDCSKVCRTTTALFFSSVSAGFTTWSCRPIAWKDHILPTNIWLPFNPNTAPKIYNLYAYVYLLIAVGCGIFPSAAVDPLIAGLAYHATTHIKILKNKLQFLGEHLAEELGTRVDENKRKQILHKRIRQCVIYHHLILNYIEEYEECFSQMAFSQSGSGVVVSWVTALQLTVVEILSFDFLAIMLFLIAMLTEVYLYCHFGTVLFKENNTLNEAIYLSRWYEFDIETRKVLILIMERAQRPMIIPVGKIFDMSLVTFAMICRRAYSLLAVLENYSIKLNCKKIYLKSIVPSQVCKL